MSLRIKRAALDYKSKIYSDIPLKNKIFEKMSKITHTQNSINNDSIINIMKNYLIVVIILLVIQPLSASSVSNSNQTIMLDMVLIIL